MLELKGLEPHLDGTGRDRLCRIQTLLENIGRELHQIARELRPTSLDDLGLEMAVTNLASEWSQRSGIDIDVHFAAPDAARLPGDVQTALHGIVQRP
jgi:two-component system sensor histidine kinase UhpB